MKTKVSIKDKIVIESKFKFATSVLIEFSDYKETEGETYKYTIPLQPYNFFVLEHLIKKNMVRFENGMSLLEEISKHTTRVPKPTLMLSGDNIILQIPDINTYSKLVKDYKLKPFGLAKYKGENLSELYVGLKSFHHFFLPPIIITEDVEKAIFKITKAPSFEELFNTHITTLGTLSKDFNSKREGFDKLGYSVLADILFSRPTRYEDRTKPMKYNEAPYGTSVLLKGTITKVGKGFGHDWYMEFIDDDGVLVNAYFYYGAFFSGRFRVGEVCYVEGFKNGKNKFSGNRAFTEIEVLEAPVLPIYKQSPSKKITSELLLSAVKEMFRLYENNNLIPYIKLNSPLWSLLKNLHLPSCLPDYVNAVEELAFLELVYLQLMFLEQKEGSSMLGGLSQVCEGKIMKQAISELPYELTDGQKTAISEIITRLNSEVSSSVLLTADVGAGKTLVGHSASLYSVESGYQVAMLAPTEILARQLYSTLKEFSKNTDVVVEYYRGVADKNIAKKVKTGEVNIVVGTHSVLSLDFAKLGLIVIDEEQKFGTADRDRLLSKGYLGKRPHIISQTATPIPRTTALAFYGNLDFVPITDKPRGRKPNITKWIHENSVDFLENKNRAELKHIFSELKAGNKVFILAPAVEKNKKMVSVQEISTLLKKTYSGLNIAEVHGKLKKAEQDKIISEFRDGDIDVLIASSIVEVGVDIPKATVMLVLDAHRFGASSLHQIRGRVGRSDLQGYCYLISDNDGKNAMRRLSALENSNNGFDIAMVDLDTRKEGDLLGLRQSGESKLIFCNLVDHSNLIYKAQEVARQIYESTDRKRALKDAKLFFRKEV